MAPYTMGSTFYVLEVFMIALDKYHQSYKVKCFGLIYHIYIYVCYVIFHYWANFIQVWVLRVPGNDHYNGMPRVTYSRCCTFKNPQCLMVMSADRFIKWDKSPQTNENQTSSAVYFFFKNSVKNKSVPRSISSCSMATYMYPQYCAWWLPVSNLTGPLDLITEWPTQDKLILDNCFGQEDILL